MSNLVFSRPLGDDLSPFGFSAKSMAIPVGAVLGAAGIAAGTSLGQSGLQHYENVRQQHFEDDQARMAYERQQELMKQEFDYSKQLWESNNAYNTPAMQVKRMREAGLNPYVYSHGSDIGTGVSGSPASSPTAPSVAKGSGSAAAMPAFHDVGSLLMQASALKNDKMRSFAQLVEAYLKVLDACNGDTAKANEVMQSLSGFSGFNGDLTYKMAISQYNKQKAEERISNIQADIEEVFGFDNAKILNSNLTKESRRLNAEIEKLISDKELNEANKELSEANKKSVIANIKTIASQIAKNMAEAAHMRASANQISQLTTYLIRSAAATADMDEMDMWEDRANFNMGTKAREWMQSEQGQMNALAEEINDDNPEAGLVEKIIRGRESRRRSGRSKRK